MRRLLLPALLVLTACGDDGAVDRSDARAVAKAVVAAMGSGDFAVLEQLMTPDCFAQLEREIGIFRTNLARPDLGEGAQVQKIGRAKLGTAWDAEAKVALAGNREAIWKLILKLQPFSDSPEIVDGRSYPDADRKSFQYRRTRAAAHQIDLRRIEGLWSVARIGF